MMGYESRKGLLVMSRKEIEDALTKKLIKLLEEKKISYEDLYEINRVKKNIFNGNGLPINNASAINMYILLVKFLNYLEKVSNKIPIDDKSVKQDFFDTYLEARGYYCKVKDFDDIYCNHILLVSFLIIICGLLESLDDIEFKILGDLKYNAQDIHKKLCTSQYPKKHDLYLGILFFISKHEIKQGLEEELEFTLNGSKNLINEEKNDKDSGIVNFIENRIIKKYIESNKENVNRVKTTDISREMLERWIDIIATTNSLEKTKYKVLMGCLEKFIKDKEATEKIITIYEYIQNIKFQLVVNDFNEENLREFGHYTNGEVLQILLRQKESISGAEQDAEQDAEQFKIEGKTRLYNVAYMNDPEEGKLLDRLFGLKKSSSSEYKVSSSPWFLMSLTTAIDKLTMWSQYGSNAEGVCLVFKTDSFIEVKSQDDLESFISKSIEIESTEDVCQKNSSSLVSKDCLYRICYLNEDSLKEGEIKLEKEDNKLLKEGTRLSKIEDLLKEIKGVLKDVSENKEELIDAFDLLLEEIRYLFKSSAYREEEELRILRYSELVPNNKEIKVHNVEPAAKLYIERDTEIGLKSIIFGPKFKEPENVTPLVHLLDKDIICKRSSKKYK
mgnify:CR=1 FL=1